MSEEVEEILAFWFADCTHDHEKAAARVSFWYAAQDATDRAIEERFVTTLRAARTGGRDHWLADAEPALALVIVLDQFPRNIWRGTADAFCCDELALEKSRAAIAKGHLKSLTPVQRTFLLMPFQHSESLATQRESVELFRALVDDCPVPWREGARNNYQFAQKHLRIIERFGRFPHRNAVLDRTPTTQETQWLASGGDTFGQ